jgi:ribosome-binding factor A
MAGQDKHVRFAGIITELAARFIQQEANTNPMITVTRVDLSKDWKSVIVFVTTIPDGREGDAMIFLKRTAGDMRAFFKKHGRMKHIPHLEFMYDAGEKHRQHMDELVKTITKEEKAEKKQKETELEPED